MKSETTVLTEEMEKLSSRISDELTSALVNWSGSLKDIDNGTLIKIPMDAGYVKLFKSSDSWSLNCWYSQNLTEKIATTPNNLLMTKSKEL